MPKIQQVLAFTFSCDRYSAPLFWQHFFIGELLLLVSIPLLQRPKTWLNNLQSYQLNFFGCPVSRANLAHCRVHITGSDLGRQRYHGALINLQAADRDNL